MNQASTKYKGKKYTQYQIDQKQRYIERQIRKYKRRAKLEKDSGLDDSKSVSFVKKWQKKLREFVKETGNEKDYSKEWINKQAFKSRLEKWVDKHCVDVTAEYLSNVVPNYAEPLKEKNYINDTSTESDEKYAKFIQEKLGGIVEMRIRGGSDYNWNYRHKVKQWEKKAPTKVKSICNRVRDGYRQLKESSDPGGLFFDLTYLQDATHQDGIWKTFVKWNIKL